MKKTSAIFLVCLLLFSCSPVKTTVPVQIIAGCLKERIEGFEHLSEASEDYIKYCTQGDLSAFSEYIVLYPFSGEKYNELGVFKVSDTHNVDDGVSVIRKYLSFKKSNWDTRYNGDEYNKICNATITTQGKYILFTILSDEDSKTTIKLFKKLLKK